MLKLVTQNESRKLRLAATGKTGVETHIANVELIAHPGQHALQTKPVATVGH